MSIHDVVDKADVDYLRRALSSVYSKISSGENISGNELLAYLLLEFDHEQSIKYATQLLKSKNPSLFKIIIRDILDKIPSYLYTREECGGNEFRRYSNSCFIVYDYDLSSYNLIIDYLNPFNKKYERIVIPMHKELSIEEKEKIVNKLTKLLALYTMFKHGGFYEHGMPRKFYLGFEKIGNVLANFGIEPYFWFNHEGDYVSHLLIPFGNEFIPLLCSGDYCRQSYSIESAYILDHILYVLEFGRIDNHVNVGFLTNMIRNIKGLEYYADFIEHIAPKEYPLVGFSNMVFNHISFGELPHENTISVFTGDFAEFEKSLSNVYEKINDSNFTIDFRIELTDGDKSVVVDEDISFDDFKQLVINNYNVLVPNRVNLRLVFKMHGYEASMKIDFKFHEDMHNEIKGVEDLLYIDMSLLIIYNIIKMLYKVFKDVKNISLWLNKSSDLVILAKHYIKNNVPINILINLGHYNSIAYYLNRYTNKLLK